MGLSKIKNYIQEGKFSKALNNIEEIEDHYSIDHPDYFELYLKKTQILSDLGQFERTVSIGNSLLNQARKANDRLSKLDAIIILGDTYIKMGELENAILMIEMGEIDFTKLDEDLDEIEFTIRYAHLKRLKGVYYRYNGELDLALEYFTESLVEAEKTEDERLIARIYNLIGLINHETGDLMSSWSYYLKSLSIREKINDLPGKAITLYNLGSIQEYIGELDSALNNYLESLEIGQKLGNARIIAKVNSNIGVIYQKKGDFDIAFEYLSKSLSMLEEIGNDVETSWSLFRINWLLLHSEKSELVPIFFDGLEELNATNPENKTISQHYRLIKASKLKQSEKTIERAEAQKIFYDLLKEDTVDHELTINAMLSLGDILLTELKTTGDAEILDEIENLFEKLLKIVQVQHSYPLLAEIYILQSKFALLELDVSKALTLITQAQEMAETKDLYPLAMKISDEYDRVLEKINEWNEAQEQGVSIIERVETAELENKIAELIKQRNKSITIQKEIPVFLMILDRNKEKIYSRRFLEDEHIDDHLIQSFIAAINNLIRETFATPGPVERIKHGNYFLISKESNKLLFIYVFKGNTSYTAIQKLEKIIQTFNENEEVLTVLQQANGNDIPVDNIPIDNILDEVIY